MIERHQLEATLRRLKLSGMLATLEARLDQARAGELGHLEFLQVLCEDEIARRAAKRLGERVRRARFEEEATLEAFDFRFNPKTPVAQIRDLATLRFIERGESVLLFGPVGVGKTMVAQALGHLACRRGYEVLFAKTARVLAELAGGRADGSWEARLRRLSRPRVLILDDFGLREFAVAQADDLYELVCERAIARRSLIVTSNRAPADWYALFPNPVVAEGALDRLVNSAHHVLMEGRSYRPPKRPDRAGASPAEALVAPAPGPGGAGRARGRR
jgi:DNA replication protein DnaC